SLTDSLETTRPASGRVTGRSACQWRYSDPDLHTKSLLSRSVSLTRVDHVPMRLLKAK
ncbi:hypothetical protein GBAR_LOCUS13537, partial [Geodia barretti]